MQILDLDIRLKSLEDELASAEATLKGEASLASTKVIIFLDCTQGCSGYCFCWIPDIR
jgi:hypothetical protein